jgi:hypothetical protein
MGSLLLPVVPARRLRESGNPGVSKHRRLYLLRREWTRCVMGSIRGSAAGALRRFQIVSSAGGRLDLTFVDLYHEQAFDISRGLSIRVPTTIFD